MRVSLGAWRFSKTSPGRQLAMKPEELDAYGERLLSLARAAS